MQTPTAIVWIKGASAVTIGFGVAIVLGAHPATAGAVQFLADMMLWPIDGAQSVTAPEVRLLNAVLGGVMVGWGLVYWLIATRLMPRDPALARSIILVSIGTWFVVDSVASVVAGAPMNAFFNLGFLGAFCLPLWRPVAEMEAA